MSIHCNVNETLNESSLFSPDERHQTSEVCKVDGTPSPIERFHAARRKLVDHSAAAQTTWLRTTPRYADMFLKSEESSPQYDQHNFKP